MTQDGLSLVSGLSVRTIAYTESGDRAPTAATLAKLARGLGVKISAFWVEDKVA